MIIKEQLCKAFCDEVEVRKVPIGLAVSTGFSAFTGDQIGFYIAGPDENGQFRIQDDGMTVFNLETAGADLEIATRAAAFEALLNEYGFSYNETEHVLLSSPLAQDAVAAKSLRFVALLLRLQDLLLMVQEHAASTFKEEVVRTLRDTLGMYKHVTKQGPSASDSGGYEPDELRFEVPTVGIAELRVGDRPPVRVLVDLREFEAGNWVIVSEPHLPDQSAEQGDS